MLKLTLKFELAALPVAVTKPPPAMGKATVIVAPWRMSPAVVPVQVVVTTPPTCVVAAQGNCSPLGLTVVGIKIVGITPTSAPVPGGWAINVNVPEPVLVQVPVTLPVKVQVWPTATAQGRPGVPETGGVGGIACVGVGVRVVVLVAVGVAVIVGVLVGAAGGDVAVPVGVAVLLVGVVVVAASVAVTVAAGAWASSAACRGARSRCYNRASGTAPRFPGGGRVPVGLAVFKTVAWPPARSRVGSTPIHLRQPLRRT